MTEVFVASNMPTDFPRKLQKPSTVSDSVRDTAETFIMDSGIGDAVTNAEVLDLAQEYEADYVIGKDYLHDQPKTTASVREFLELHAERNIEATPMVPLQPPHHEHYEELAGHSHYVLGGMATDEFDTQQKVRWTEKALDTLPRDAYVHALGVGGGYRYTSAVCGMGLDSIDCSTPEQAAMFGAVLTDTLSQQTVLAHGGGQSKSRRTHPLAEFNSWQVQDVWDRESQHRNKQSEFI